MLACAGRQGAAERQDLNKRVFQRLNLSMLTLAGGLAALEALHLSALTPGGAAIGAMASLPALLVAGVHYQRTSGHGLNPLPVLTVRAWDGLSKCCVLFDASCIRRRLHAAFGGAALRCTLLVMPQAAELAVPAGRAHLFELVCLGVNALTSGGTQAYHVQPNSFTNMACFLCTSYARGRSASRSCLQCQA